jgi:hypothetical protein
MNDIFLQNFSGGAFYLRLNPETRVKKRVFKFRQPIIKGWYGTFDDRILAVYKLDGKLYISLDDDEYALSDALSTEWEPKDENATFKIYIDELRVFEKVYKRKAFQGLNKHDLNYVESNDDLFLSLHELVNNPDSWKDTFNYHVNE